MVQPSFRLSPVSHLGHALHLKDAYSTAQLSWHGQDMYHSQLSLSKGTVGLNGGPVW